jgi:hypothetical protein
MARASAWLPHLRPLLGLPARKASWPRQARGRELK